jgi:hypothetical protein
MRGRVASKWGEGAAVNREILVTPSYKLEDAIYMQYCATSVLGDETTRVTTQRKPEGKKYCAALW